MSHSGPGAIPPRWLNCPRKSIDLIGNKFLAFKTPLGSQFQDQVPPENIFTPQLLMASMKGYKVKIGLWIDLTNTSRFYDKNEVEKEGIRYVKLSCAGIQCPSVYQVTTFVQICERFIAKNPLEIIAVHCTHGFNRTGFMINSYLVMKNEWSCDKAVLEFSRLRPPGIYKHDYLVELYARLDDAESTPANGPEKPSWCYENEGTDDDGETVSNGGSSGSRKGRKERVTKNAAFMDGVPGVTLFLDQPKLKSIQRKIQTICGWNGSGFPGCQPVSMTRENVRFLGENPYKVSWKADGTRYMMFIDGKDEVYFADRNNSIFKASNLHFPDKRDLKKHLCDTLLDGEMVIDTHSNTQYPRYLIYDAVRINGKDIMNDDFHMRFERIMTDIISPRHGAIEQGLLNKAIEPFSIRRKDFWELNAQTTGKLLSSSFKEQLAHEPDGLILQPLLESYIAGTAHNVLKWKPPTHNSVDFKLKVVKKSGEGLLTTTIGELYVGGLDTPFSSMSVNKTVKACHGKIIECKLVNHKWVFMRERTDKSFPNSYKTTVAVCESIANPVTEEMLLDYVEHYGFKKSDRELMPPPPKRRRV